MIPYRAVSSRAEGRGLAGASQVQTRSISHARIWKPGMAVGGLRRRCWSFGNEVVGVGGMEEVPGMVEMLLPSKRTVWMTIASVGTLGGASTNYTTAQIWKSMSCQVWHSAQRDQISLLQRTLLRDGDERCVR